MSESICRFIPDKDYVGDLKTVHFVYETEHDSLEQPFLRATYYLFLVTDGEAVLSVAGKEHKVAVGDLFFAFPGHPYELRSNGSFRYLYISFFGSCVYHIFDRLNIGIDEPVYRGFGKVSEFWFSAISRLNKSNADLLSESVLLYTLSFLESDAEPPEIKQNGNTIFEMILEYVNNHYREHALTLSSVASIFFYTESYLSSMFKKQMRLGFNQYVNHLRISYALRLIENGCDSVRKIASESGFADPLYFSKVFKKNVGVTPTDKIKNR
jgi:AraC-like DNA-binding protein